MRVSAPPGHHVRVARKLGTAGPPASAVPAAAVRATSPGWRDPRLWVGVLVIAASVVGGARLFAAADDTAAVWAAAADLGPGDRVEESDLTVRRVRFADADDLDRYFTVEEELPADLEVVRGVGEGELLPREAVGSATDSDTVQLPLAVDAEQVPPSVSSGSVVDVYLVADGRRRVDGPALQGATVVDAPPVEQSFTTTGKRQLVLAVPDAQARQFFRLLGTLQGPVISVVRRG